MKTTIESVVQEFSDREQEGWSFDEKVDWLHTRLTAALTEAVERVIEEERYAGAASCTV